MQEFILFLLGLITGFIGSNAGGSSLITVPVLISLGIAPPSAVATSRVASLGSMVAGIGPFHKEGKIDYKLALPSAFFALLGSVLGAYLLIHIPIVWVQKAIGLLTLLFTLLSFVKRKEKTEESVSNFKKIIGWISFFLCGLIGGFFGAQAILATYVFILIFNKTFIESLGTRKITGLAVAIPAVLLYGFHDLIHWISGLALVSGSFIGSSFGSRYAIKRGDKWIRPLFTALSIILSLKLLFF